MSTRLRAAPLPALALALALVLPGGRVGAAMDGIQWFEGSVDAAFRQARSLNRPLFLYWGASWCPPCQQLKATVFRRPDFRQRLQQFVAVHLDGDSTDAQRWGERFGVLGYPTVILFDPRGRELARVPGGLELEAYARILDAAASHPVPVAVVAQRALAREPLTPAGYRLLAFHSWEQDRSTVPARRRELFQWLAATAPAGDASTRARLLGLWLEAIVAAEAAPAETEMSRARRALAEALGSAAGRAGMRSTLFFSSTSLVDLLAGGDPGRRRTLAAAWIEAATLEGEAPGLSCTERLASLLPEVELRPTGSPVAAATLERIDARVRDCARSVQDPGERQAVIHMAVYLLERAGQQARARALLEAELERSASPHYLMTGLAELAQRSGRPEEALDWLRRAHRAARGAATRFQWGTYWVRGLTELRPGDERAIEDATLAVLEEWARAPDALFGRNRRRLSELGEAIAAWAREGGHTASFRRIRQGFRSHCASLPRPESGFDCAAWPAAVAGAEQQDR